MSQGINSAEMEAYIADRRLSARLKIVRHVAQVELKDPYLAMFLKVLKVIEGLAQRRQGFAHGVWNRRSAS